MNLGRALMFCAAACLLLPIVSEASARRPKGTAHRVNIQEFLKEIRFPGEIDLKYDGRTGAYKTARLISMLGGFSILSDNIKDFDSYTTFVSAIKKKAYLFRTLNKLERHLKRSGGNGVEMTSSACFDRGVLQFLKGSLAGALGGFYDALEVEPGNRPAANWAVAALGLIWCKLDERQRIDWSYQIAGRVGAMINALGDNSRLEDYLLAARLYYLAEVFEPAMYYIEKGLKKYADDPRLLFARSLVWARTGELKSALEDIEKVIHTPQLKEGLKRDAIYAKEVYLIGLGVKKGPF